MGPTDPQRLTENVGGSFFQSDDQTEIYYKLWKPEIIRPVAVVLAFHGLGDHINRYDHVFEKFAKAGILVKGMDMRGHGRTNIFHNNVRPLQGYTHSFERIYKDMMTLYELEVEGVPLVKKLPTFVFGHSMGGLLSVCFTYKCSHLLDNYKGTIAQAPAFKPAKAPPAVLKWIAVNLGGWIPRYIDNNQLELSGLSSDPEIISEYNNDPFVHGKISMQLARDILKHADYMVEQADKFVAPLLVYHSPDDKLTDFVATTEFFVKVASTDKFMKAMNGCAHERNDSLLAGLNIVHNELGDAKYSLIESYNEWILNRLN